MKFLAHLSFLVASVNAATKSFAHGYDSLNPSVPYTSASPIVPNPYGSIQYANSFSVAEVSTQFLSELTPVSKPNVLLSTLGTVQQTTHSFRKTSSSVKTLQKIKYFQAQQIGVACAHTTDSATSLIPCSILVEGIDAGTGSSLANDIIAYDGSGSMKNYKFSEDFKNLRGLDFTVYKAGQNNETKENVNIVLDSFYYQTTF